MILDETKKNIISDLQPTNNVDIKRASATRPLQNTFKKEIDMFACETIRREDYFNIINQKINSAEFKFLNYEVNPLSKKSGIFGEHYILRLRIKRDDVVDELRFFLKTLPQAETQRSFTLEMGAFYKEEEMFQNLMPLFIENRIELIKECAPRCFFAEPEKFLIFEDLSAKGFGCLNARVSFDLDLVKLVVKSMVALHASSLILEEKMRAKLNRKWRFYEEYPEQFREMLYCDKPSSLALLDGCINGTSTEIDYLGLDTEGFKDFARAAVESFVDVVKPSKKYRNAICHGDLWAANIMFRFENSKPTNCILVDFQSYRYCPPAQDLLTFLYLSTDRKFREEHYKTVLEYYYGELSKSLAEYDLEVGEILSREEFGNSCEDAKLFAIAQSVTHFQIVMMSPENMAEFLADPEFNRRSMFEDRSDVIVMMCEKDEFYKTKQVESVMDLRELYFCRKNVL